MVADINPAGGSNPANLTTSNGKLFFSATDGAHGYELWKTDGTAFGTAMVKDIGPGPGDYGRPDWLADVNGTLFFDANDGEHGQELWKSDGTVDGTVLVKDIIPGPYGSQPISLTNFNGTLYFSADDGTHGRQLWKSDGSTDGTVMVNDSGEASQSSLYLDCQHQRYTLFLSTKKTTGLPTMENRRHNGWDGHGHRHLPRLSDQFKRCPVFLCMGWCSRWRVGGKVMVPRREQ